ncbi:MAG: tetratricopeptide repeat protein [Gemmatimonadales bacterium]|nr:tetratricopeptide repeat protein [Gemmatimonadales bacterium]
MIDEIRTLTQRLADEPSSLAFLELGESLRRRGQVGAAYKVARGGLNRYPGLADAHDLMARILSDQGDFAGAFDAWADALRFDPMRTGALKGIAFLYFRAGDVDAALDHLHRAAEADPDDPAVPQAIARVRRDSREAGRAAFAPALEPLEAGTEEPVAGRPEPVPAPAAPPVPPSDSPFTGVAPEEEGLLLVDANGMCLAGSLTGRDGTDAAERVAAQLAGLTREAARATRLLGLGSWHSIAVESPDAHLFLASPTAETVLLAVREPELPMARVGLLAERATRAARGWLERVQ